MRKLRHIVSDLRDNALRGIMKYTVEYGEDGYCLKCEEFNEKRVKGYFLWKLRFMSLFIEHCWVVAFVPKIEWFLKIEPHNTECGK